MRRVGLIFALALMLVSAAPAEPIDRAAIRVIDGDTIAVAGITYRLVGYDTPEVGRRAHCVSERELGAKATARLKALIAGGGIELNPVACSCRRGAEGTPACNHGRLCGVLMVHGRDVGETLIGEGLAHPLRCGPRSCPGAMVLGSL